MAVQLLCEGHGNSVDYLLLSHLLDGETEARWPPAQGHQPSEQQRIQVAKANDREGGRKF